MEELVKVATAECFTHGGVAREIHAFSRGYPLKYPWSLERSQHPMVIVSGLFIPTLDGVRHVLGFEPPTPICAPDGIKVYNQTQDITIAIQMARSVMQITHSHVGIGTSAGVGMGAVALVTENLTITDTTDVFADLTGRDTQSIMRRKKAGIMMTLQMFERLIETEKYL